MPDERRVQLNIPHKVHFDPMTRVCDVYVRRSLDIVETKVSFPFALMKHLVAQILTVESEGELQTLGLQTGAQANAPPTRG